MTTPMALKHFLSEAKTAEIEQGLSELAAKKLDTYLGVWCAETGFCVVVEVAAGIPYQWHVRGPLDLKGARVWLGIVESEIHSGSESSKAVH